MGKRRRQFGEQFKFKVALEAVKELGIDDKDIQTSNYSVYATQKPVRDTSPQVENEEEHIEYVVSNQVRVTVRDLELLGDLLDKAMEAGANAIYGIGFTVDDPSALEAEARANAVADARARAESLAELHGVQVGDVLSISEVIGGPVPVMEAARSFAGTGAPIETGELEVSLSVQVTYIIR